MKRPPSALWLCHKPAGKTSFEVLQAFRRPLEGPWKLAAVHGGVLDPFASGLLVVLVGAATRLFDWLHEAPKRYVAVVRWGEETDTGDGGGKVVGGNGEAPDWAAVEAATRARLGWSEQVPPATSNKRVDGERAYLRAHRGEAVVLPPSRVYLHQARWSRVDGDGALEARLELVCRGGFYVRSLVRDVGRAVGVGAHVVTLERTHIGPWACPPPEAPVALSGGEVLPWLPGRRLSDDEWGKVRRGEAIDLGATVPAPWAMPEGFPPGNGVRLVHRERLVGVARVRGVGETGKAKVVLVPGGV